MKVKEEIVTTAQVGEIGNFCTCLKPGDKTLHFTNTMDGTHCQYCDHLLKQEIVEGKHWRKHKKWVKTKSDRDNIELAKRDRFYEKMERLILGDRQ